MFNNIKNNKATILINRVYAYFIILIVIGAVMNVTLLITLNIVTSYQASFYAEKISVQGGLLGDERKLPGDINSTKNCTSCMTNADLSENFGRTMKKFQLIAKDWSLTLIDDKDSIIPIHKNGRTVNTKEKVLMEYMSVGELQVTVAYKPKFIFGSWKNSTITKVVPIVSEYIPR